MDMSLYNVTWDSQSADSSESMPLGGCDTGCNVWVQNGKLYVYVSESGTFDENNTMLKLTRLRVELEGGGLSANCFSQTLNLDDGAIYISAGEGDDAARIRLWAAVTKPELHIECETATPRRWIVSAECWRYKRRAVTTDERSQCRDFDVGIGRYSGEVYTEPDVVQPGDDALSFYHRNKDKTVWDLLIEQQKLGDIKESIPNPLYHRTMGGVLMLPGMSFSCEEDGVYAKTDFRAYRYVSDAPETQRGITLTLLTGCFDTVADWEAALAERAAEPANFADTAAWWREYMEHGYIIAADGSPDSEEYRIARNYQLFRYMLGCNYYGEYPTKFNGGLFTFDVDHTPDFRMWSGGGFTSQNQRLVYWGMLKTGDFAGMLPQLDYFRKLTDAAKARVRRFFGFDGAFFNEQGNLFGICTGAEYRWERGELSSDAFEDSPWVRLHLSTGLEFALMMLEYSRYSGKAIPEFADYIDSIVDFYYNYYGVDDDGKLRIFPSTALETYKGADPYSRDDAVYGCENPTDAVAGLRCVTEEYIAYLRGHDGAPDTLTRFERYRGICPEIAADTDDSGRRIWLPAARYDPKPFNCELPQLYRVFPFSPRGMSGGELETGKNTYETPYPSRDMYLGCSWHQNGIFAARLGLFEEARKYLGIKLDDGPFRFPAFWGPGHDWMPDHNHGGSGIIGLEEMLMQCGDREIYLLPCWDKNIDVSFKLHAPYKTTVECVWRGGALESLTVTPESRLADIVLPQNSR